MDFFHSCDDYLGTKEETAFMESLSMNRQTLLTGSTRKRIFYNDCSLSLKKSDLDFCLSYA